MANPFVAEIRIVGFNFAPIGWALCNGQLMSISQNTALFALLGTTYGGDGKSTFGLPNLQATAPMNAGQGSGLSQRFLGKSGGETAVTLLTSTMPSHTHAVACLGGAGSTGSPTGGVWANDGSGRGIPLYASAIGSGPTMNPGDLQRTGGGQPHNNMPPYLCLYFIIALQGVFPQRS
jgi:microcystin-dependent protein